MIILIVVLLFSWLYMQWTHELGHIIAGLATGAQLERVILNPFRFSMTQFASNPHPHITTWGGPVLGVLIGAGIPILLARFLKQLRFSLCIVSSFVLLANGLYIGLGAITPFADAQDLIRYGSTRLMLAAFGIVCAMAARWRLIPILDRRLQPSSLAESVPYIIMAITLATTGLIMFR
jgi:hypothetical protein